MVTLALLTIPAEAQASAAAQGKTETQIKTTRQGKVTAQEGTEPGGGTEAQEDAGATDDAGDCEGARFTATAEADLARVTVLDAGVLRPDLPALADVRLASARGEVDSGRRPHRAVAAGRYADAKLFGLRAPGVPVRGAVAESRAPHGRGPAAKHDRGLVSVNTGGLATVRLGQSTADTHWDNAYLCGETGPLTRSATTLAGAQFLGGGGATPAMRTAGTGAGERTSLLQLGPTGSTRSATDLVRRKGRLAVTAAAGVALPDLTLFAGTSQEVSIKVVTQPELTVTATGHRAYDEVDYRPAVLEVTAAGKPVATLGTRDTSVGVELVGGLDTTSLLSAEIALGDPRAEKTGDFVRAEAAALRIEVTLGGAHLLDVALGNLYAEASAPPLLTIPARVKPSATHRAFKKPAAPVQTPPTTPPVARTTAEPVRQVRGALASTGANVAAAATGGLLLIVLGIVAVALTRRRGRRH